MDASIPRALRVAAILALLSLVVWARFHEPTRVVHALQKLAHPLTFGAIALLLTLPGAPAPRSRRAYLGAFALTVLGGAGTEVAQAFVGRDASLVDVLRDALGASTALAGFATLLPGRDARGRGGWRALGALLALAGLAAMMTAARDRARGVCAARPRIPDPSSGVLAARSLFRARLGCRGHYHALDGHEGRRACDAGRVCIRALRPAHQRLELAIPIKEIERAPAGRSMDLSQIAGPAVFRDRGTMSGSFDVERILLKQ